MISDNIVPYAGVILKLLQQPLYSDDSVYWNQLLTHYTAIEAYFAQIGLQILLFEDEGFAYLTQPDLLDDTGEPISLPRLTKRMPLSYHATILGVIMREELNRFETSPQHDGRCLITHERIHELMLPFLREQHDERIVERRINSAIESLLEVGFIRRIIISDVTAYFEVRPIIKAKFDADTLAHIKEMLTHDSATEP